ncbi:MAG: PP2C family protein-serine/threonine phosphatase [Anaerolineae bacterium]
MSTLIRSFWQTLVGHDSVEPVEVETMPLPVEDRPQAVEAPAVDIASDDPIIDHFQRASAVVETRKLDLESPAVQALKDAGVRMVMPLVSQQDLVGMVNLGPRLSEQEYSADDRRLLNTLATQVTPAVRVAQLVRQQQLEALARERLEHELRVARFIQQTLLPKDVPQLPGWHVSAYWQPARAVGGDFYDFIGFPDGRMGFVIGDVTDKGVPAALVMATTRSILRGAAERLVSPGQVLERVNDVLCPDIPTNMFVTCLYAVLDPDSGRLQYANAGHNLPYQLTTDGVIELRATGMPLGLMPDMPYDEKEATLSPGECVLLSSDGLVEAHSHQGEMFGFPRVKKLMANLPGGATLIDHLLADLAGFTGGDWEQEDDITLLTIDRR